MSHNRQTRARGLRAGTAVLALMALLSGCGGGSATPSAAPASAGPSPTPADTTPRGGSVTMRLGADISTWDPCIVPAGTIPGTGSDPLAAVYGALVYTDVNGVVQPGMAKSLTSPDAVTWTFKLRSGVKFTDGTAFDAAALKYNLDRASDPARGCTNQKWLGSWKSISVVDTTTLAVTLPSADASFPLKIAELDAYVASPTALAAAKAATDIKPIGAGPFTVQAWNPGASEVFARNPAYWDSPRPYLDALKMVTVPDSATGQAGVLAGNVDFMMGFLYQYGTNATAPGVTTYQVPINGYNTAFFVTQGGTTGLFNDVDARQAVAVAVDRNKWAATLTQDPTVKAPSSLFPTTSPYYDSSLVYPSYDQTKAQSLIDKVVAKSKKFEFTILAPNNADTQRSAQYLAQVMNAYKGVSAQVSLVAAEKYSQECLAKHGDICIQPGATMWNGPEPNTFNVLDSAGSQPFAAYSNPSMDTALAKTLTAVTDADKVAAYKEVQTTFYADLPFIEYAQQNRSMLTRNDVAGFVFAGQGQIQAQYLYRCATRCQS